jgi:mono/diheme cytochrome c family protein
MKKFLKVAGYSLLAVGIIIGGLAFYVAKFLPKVGNPPDMHVYLTTDKVERGRYLAHSVALCMDCHSTRDWSLYAGPPMPGTLGVGGEHFSPDMGFPGHIYSRNITPFRLKDWTDGEIYRAITTGVSKDGSAIFPLMPYKYYGQMDPEDIQCIIAYLRTLAPIESKYQESKLDFPVSLLVNLEPQKAKPTKRPEPSDSLAYGKYMITAAGCVECHTPADDKGAIIAGREYSGGRVFKMPGGVLKTPNITQDVETGIGNWNADMFVQRFKMYADTGYHPAKVNPTDFNTIMPWTMYAQMKESDIRAIYTYLKTVKPIKNKVEKFSPNNAVSLR